ncbi:MAG: RNA 2',3'-cyclic phosphodiesterase [Phycisphaerae bacterium]|jgi:2'-5' RNA ligase
MRCFVAVALAPALRRSLLRLLGGLPRSREVRWCTEDQLHVTLKFLGDVADGRVPQVAEVMKTAAAGIEPFALRLGKLGCFPSPRHPRVLWCGLDDAANGCARWLAAADPLLGEMGFERETRAFTPHITLGRSKSSAGSGELQRALETTAPPPAEEIVVEEVTLFESRLLPQGAQYTVVATAKLGRA